MRERGLFDDLDTDDGRRLSIQERFETFHQSNPEVYELFNSGRRAWTWRLVSPGLP